MVSHLQRALDSLWTLLTPTLRNPGPYTKDTFRADLIAGITVAVIQIPQTMAFALIAGLPAIYGLYASLPGIIAGLWGSSRQLSTGPVAIVSVLTFTALTPFAEPRTSEYIGLAAALAVIVGIIYFLLGVFRFGYIMQLVPHSVITGFSSAAAVIIVITQLPTLFGLPSAQHNLAIQNAIDFLFHIPQLSFASFGIGIAVIAFLYASRRLPKQFPSALVILFLSIGAGYAFLKLSVPVIYVGGIPPGIPDLAIPPLSIATLLLLLPQAAVIALVGFVGTHATAKTAAATTREKLDTDQELVGQGLANVATGFLAGFPIAGSLTRTAINVEAGARTPIAGIVGAAATIITLILFTPIFTYLPRSALAAIVIVSAIPLIHWRRIRSMTDISRTDGLLAMLTAGLALIVAPNDAIFIGIVAALMVFLWQTTSGARVSEMGVNPQWNILRGRRIDDTVEIFPGTVIAHIGMSLYYANTEHLLSQCEHIIRARENGHKETIKHLILDMSGVHFIDISALEMLNDFIEDMHERKIQVGMIYLRHAVRLRLEKMNRPARITIFHNIIEIKNVCAHPSQHTLTLHGSKPEYLEATH